MTSQRRLNVAALRPKDVVLSMPDGRDYPVRGNLPVETMMELLELEERIGAGVGADVIPALVRVNMIIGELVREQTPDAPESFGLGLEELMGTVSFILGDDSVAAAVMSLVTDDATPEELEAARAEAEATGAINGESDAPLASVKPLSSISSGSESTTDGRPSTGATSPGAVSESTPRTPVAS